MFNINAGMTDEQIVADVINLWEAGKDWDEIAEIMYIPVLELLEYSELEDLFWK